MVALAALNGAVASFATACRIKSSGCLQLTVIMRVRLHFAHKASADTNFFLCCFCHFWSLPAATCAVVVGTSDPYGVECGTPFTQVERNTTLHLKKLQTYTKDGCIVGLKTQFGYKAGEAKLLGSSAGAERTLALGDSEYINGVDIGENATCINFLRFTTGKGQNLAVGGGAGALVTKPRTDAYVFGFAGTAGGELHRQNSSSM